MRAFDGNENLEEALEALRKLSKTSGQFNSVFNDPRIIEYTESSKRKSSFNDTQT